METNTENELRLLDILEQEMRGDVFSVQSTSNLIFFNLFSFPSLNIFQKECLLWLADVKKRALLIAAKHGKTKVVSFLLECGVDPNIPHQEHLYISIDENCSKFFPIPGTAAEIAFLQCNNEMLLLLLEAGSDFPLYIELRLALNFFNEEAKQKISNLIKERDQLHQLIVDGDLEAIKSMELNKGAKYLNVDNHSALFTAIQERQFKIYAELQKKGAKFKDEIEKKIIESLNNQLKEDLQNALLESFESVENAHIHYLISKSRSQELIPELYDKMKSYYDDLNEISELSCILKVVQHAEYLDIIFDFDDFNISNICPTQKNGEATSGITYFNERKIYLGAGGSDRNNIMLGTLIHELTHLAMDMVYRNYGNPYTDEDNINNNLMRSYLSQCEEGMKNKLQDDRDEAMDIFRTVQAYAPNEWHREYIARISQTLIQFGNGKGREWLEKNKIFSKLFEYGYQNQIMTDCEKFIQSSFLMNNKRIASFLHCATMEQFAAFQSSRTFYGNMDPNKNLFKNNDERILIYKVQSTMLGLAKIIQGIFDASPLKSHEKYIILKLGYFLLSPQNKEEILSKPNSPIIFEIPFYDNLEMDKTIMKICKFVLSIPNQIVFVVHKDKARVLKTAFKKEQVGEKSDDELTLFHFNKESRERILRSKVCFQGKDIELGELVAEDDNVYKKIKPDFIEDLLKGKKPKIGGTLYKMSGLEGAYANVYLDVNFDSFRNAFNKMDNVFIIEKRSKKDEDDEGDGDEDENKKQEEDDNEDEDDDIIDYFKNYVKDEEIYLHDFKKKLEESEHKIIIVADFSEKLFEKFCRYNQKRRIYWIKIKSLQGNSFMLRRLYNPNIYVERKLRKITEGSTEKTAGGIKSAQEGNISSKENLLYKLLTLNEKEILQEIRQTAGVLPWAQENNKNSTECVKGVLVNEINLIPQIINQKLLILADYPGMGKSTTLTSLYANSSIQDKHWIIRINLVTHAAVFEGKICLDGNPTLTVKTIISCLREIEPNLLTEPNAAILESLFLKNKKKCLLLAFDGFDEILDENRRNSIITMFKFLKDKTLCKVWVTTRLHYKTTLENELNTFAVELEPLDEDDKKDFIKKYFQERLMLVLKPETHFEVFSDKGWKIDFYAETLLEKMKEIFVNDVEKIIGTPLQLNLVLSGSDEHFINWLGINHEEPFPDFNYLGKNILEVFKAFIERKFEIYFKKIGQPQSDLQKLPKDVIECYHINLAASWLFDFKTLKPDENIKEIVLSLGLVQTHDDKNFEFIHFMFREFYCAEKVLRYFTDRFQNPTRQFNSSDENNLTSLKKIFSRMNYMASDQVICKFINIGLEKFNKFNIPEEIYREIGNILEDATALHFAAKKGCENVFSLLFSSCKLVLSETPSTGENREFSQATDLPIFKLKDYGRYDHSQFGVAAFLFHLREAFEHESLLVLILQGGKKTLEVLFEELKSLPQNDREVVLLTQYLEFYILMDPKNYGILHLTLIHKKFELFEFINEEAKIILERDGHCKLLEKLDENLETILHHAIACQNTEIVRYLLHEGTNSLSKEEYKSYILMKNAFGDDSFRKAFRLKDLNIAKLLAEIMKEVLSKEEFEDYIMLIINTGSLLKNIEPEFFGVKPNYRLRYNLNAEYEILSFLLQSIDYFQDKKKWATLQFRDNEEGQDKLISVLYHYHPEEIETELKNITGITSSAEFEKRIAIKDDVGRTILHVAALDDRLFQDNFKETHKNTNGEFSGMNSENNEDRMKELELMKILLKKATELLSQDQWYAFLSAQDGSGKTALHLAAYNQNLRTTELMLRNAVLFLTTENFKKLITIKDKKCRNVLHYAVYYADVSIEDMELLLSLLAIAKKILSKAEYHEFSTLIDAEKHFALQSITGPICDPFAVESKIFSRSAVEEAFTVIENFFDFIESQDETDQQPSGFWEKFSMFSMLLIYIKNSQEGIHIL